MNQVAKTFLNVMRIEVLLAIGLLIWVMSIEVKADDTDEDEVIMEMSEEKFTDLIMMNLCQLQSEQFGNVVRLRVETNSLAEISFQCFLNGGFGNTDEGKAQYKTMQEASELGVSSGTPTEQCNYFSNLAFEIIKEPTLFDVDTWVQEGKNFWFKSCMENLSD